MSVDDSPLEFIQAQEWKYRLTDNGKEIQVETCPICHKGEWKFSMNRQTGMWNCMHINTHAGKNVKGSLVRLRKILGLTLDVQSDSAPMMPLGYTECRIVELAHADLMSNPVKLSELLDEWSITEADVRKWQLGNFRDNSNHEWLVIPHFVGGKLYNIKYRSWFGLPKTFRRVNGAASVLLNEDALTQEKPPEAVLLCEGEKDAFLAMSAGCPIPAIGMTGGAGTLLERWYNLLENVETIYAAYDGDKAGSEGTQNLIKRLGSGRMRIVPMPAGKDIADVVKEQGPQAFLDLFRKAAEPAEKIVSHISGILDEMMVAEDKQAIPCFSKNITHILNGGAKGGQVIVLTAPPKIGKTTFSVMWCLYVASVLKIPSLLWCVEMPKADLAKYVISARFGTGRAITKADVWMMRQRSAELPLYFGYDGNTTIEVLTQTFRDIFRTKGVRCFVFDNIHFMVRNAENKVTAIEDAMKSFKMLAMDLDVPIVLIAQPSGAGGKKGANMNYYDIGWSSSFASDADTICIMHRERVVDTENSFSDKLMFKVDAGRYTPGGTTYLQFFESMCQFRDYSHNEIKAAIAAKK